MKAIFIDPNKQEHEINTIGLPYGGRNGSLFIDAILKGKRNKGTYCTSEVKVMVPFLEYYDISNKITKIVEILKS